MVSLKKLHATRKHFTLSLPFQEACLVLYSSPFQKEVLPGHLSFGIRTLCAVAAVGAWLLRGGGFSWAPPAQRARNVPLPLWVLWCAAPGNGSPWSTVSICRVPWGGGSLLLVSSVLAGAPVPPYTSQALSESCLGGRCSCPVVSMASPVFRLEDPWHIYDLVVWFWFILEKAVLPG